jgi:hypothetical protein
MGVMRLTQFGFEVDFANQSHWRGQSYPADEGQLPFENGTFAAIARAIIRRAILGFVG